MPPTRAWLVRHGQSEANAGIPGPDPGATPLTPLGRRQAERVAQAVPEAPALIVTSPFARARATAERTIARFPGSPVQEWPVQEYHYLGQFHDLATTSGEREPYVRAYWERADPHLVNGDAESFADLIDRVELCLTRLDQRPEGLVAVFTHGMFTMALLWWLLTGRGEVTTDAMRRFRTFADACRIPNGCIVELRYPGPVALPGSTAHLPAAT
ncbi:histidine phosphatase family protein [Pseudonocardia acaciae]|uniref:histidine phosphatase family protein n=1 Tax=Pseudonocardia acaciae TaxID=551276 RepID=UPI0004918E8F|nr:histidine phosphatase family protein [Pseudonocardia acaciae]